ncbi:hypothetical protein [Streptosporangium saharense]|uniref:Tissue inhibitor of metalloproteinase n=1 Tax=Streptosporangium saharense TaxID=1706840 RepID=A0A7W7QL15_9ACTN|nr:hypothetical protein [Streptosporangium saharense]MBB4915458.1 hypothetical protein [Streptosporangium saharense]
MMNRVVTVLLLVAAAIVAIPGTACACSCAPLKPTEQVGNASVVFTGTVLASRPAKGDFSVPTPPVVYTFRIDQVYKGQAQAEYHVTTNVDSAACGYNFEPGARYLVFASSRESGMIPTEPGLPLHTALCDGDARVRPGTGPLVAQDGFDGQPLPAALLTALGKPTAPAPTPTATTAPAGGAGGGGSSPSPWAYLGGAVVLGFLALAGWRLTTRRQTTTS